MERFTRKDMEFQREAYATSKARIFVKEAVAKIYHEAIKTAVETSSHAYYHTIRRNDDCIDIDDVAIAIRDELIDLFPDFRIEIRDVNDGYNRSRSICVSC
jgi:hypothetical protein